MVKPAFNPLPKSVLFELLPAAFEPWGASDWYPSRPPTDASIRRIQTELNTTIPPLFVEVAAACSSYGGWFGSIGEDFSSQNHLLEINRGFHDEGLPKRYVMLNHGHDGFCDAWDLEAPLTAVGEAPIRQFSFDDVRKTIVEIGPPVPSFAEYIDVFVRNHAPGCPVKGLRRRAKRILSQLEGPSANH